VSANATQATSAVETLYRSDWGRIVATLIRLVGDFDLAEESAPSTMATATARFRETTGEGSAGRKNRPQRPRIDIRVVSHLSLPDHADSERQARPVE